MLVLLSMSSGKRAVECSEPTPRVDLFLVLVRYLPPLLGESFEGATAAVVAMTFTQPTRGSAVRCRRDQITDEEGRIPAALP